VKKICRLRLTRGKLMRN